MSRVANILLGIAISITAGCASQRLPGGDPNTRSTKAIERRAEAERQRDLARLENEFLELEKELGRARARDFRRQETTRRTLRLIRLEDKIKQARQDLRELKVVSDDSFERLTARLTTALPELRASCREF